MPSIQYWDIPEASLNSKRTTSSTICPHGANDLTKVALIRASPPAVIKEYGRPTYPCLSIAHLSGFLKAHGIEVLPIDLWFDRFETDEIKGALLNFKPNIIGFTAMTHEITYAAKLAKELKTMFPDSLMVIGGAHATVAPERTLQEFSVFDIAAFGEGEITLLELVKAINERDLNLNRNFRYEIKERSMQALGLIKGIAWRSIDGIKINAPRELIYDLDSLPFPNYDHIKRKIEIYPIFSSRGCPYKCIFCCRTLGDKIRTRSPQNVIDEIEFAINRFDLKIIDFADDTFTILKKRTMEICDLLIRKGLNRKIKWTALSRVTGVDQELFNKMKEAGCIRVSFGVESGNSEILKIIKKGITVTDAENAVKMAKKAGLKTCSFFIIAHPYETVETIRDTIRLATRLNTNAVSFAIMVPYLGTEVYRMATRGEGNYKLLSEKWEDYINQFGNALELKELPRKEIEKWQRKAYLTFYLRNYRFLDILRLVIARRELLWKMLRK